MGKPKKEQPVKQAFKKELKKKIASQLTGSLVELRNLLGEKKFNTRIRKASKIFSAGVKQEPENQPGKNRKTKKNKTEELANASEKVA